MFAKILIANRGEIACRIIATCRRLGIATVAIYSEADAQSRHVALADEAYPVGPAAARESYLNIGSVIDAAVRAGAQAIHPGYGFLSENAEFAQACAAAGIVFIGPPAAAIRAMGSKAAAKALMQQAGVPLVPGYHGADQDDATLAAAATAIGYPVLIKASAGGGGKGMRVVTAPRDLIEALAAARGEARSAFGDTRLLIEKYLTAPRHIEIQVFGDQHGNLVYLFERDCSIQRRHQKIIEEAPAYGITAAQRAAMGEAAIAACRAVAYVGAGTIEFIVEGDVFAFMEMNTRLQVEHPVTELITGQDLVEWQLRVAAGELLPLLQHELRHDGHAIEARIYAEDPARDFMPSTGRITHLRQPRRRAHVRVDSGVRAGDAITPHYDPMIAKLIVWGCDRDAAVARLGRALAEYQIGGVRTNIGLLRAVAASAGFQAGGCDTGYIGQHPEMLAAPAPALEPMLAYAAAIWTARAERQRANPPPAGDPWSPWNEDNGWQLNLSVAEHWMFADGQETVSIEARTTQSGLALTLAGVTVPAQAVFAANGELSVGLDGIVQRVRVLRAGAAFTVIGRQGERVLELVSAMTPARARTAIATDRVLAPLPARVARVLVAVGQAVRRGETLVVLEAMKMEMNLAAPGDGIVAAIGCRVDAMVGEGAELIRLDPSA